MVYNPILKREIPDGWGCRMVREVLTGVQRGLSYSSQEISGNVGLPMLNLACFDKSAKYRYGELKYFSGDVDDCNYAHPGDLLIACTDLTRNADIIGRPVIVPRESEQYCFSTDLAKLKVGDIVSKEYLCHCLRMPSYHKYIKYFASGTMVLHLDIKGVLNYNIVVPDDKLLDDFTAIVKSSVSQCADLLVENSKLTSLRDFLLPLLMNGQVEVGE